MDIRLAELGESKFPGFCSNAYSHLFSQKGAAMNSPANQILYDLGKMLQSRAGSR